MASGGGWLRLFFLISALLDAIRQRRRQGVWRDTQWRRRKRAAIVALSASPEWIEFLSRRAADKRKGKNIPVLIVAFASPALRRDAWPVGARRIGEVRPHAKS